MNIIKSLQSKNFLLIMYPLKDIKNQNGILFHQKYRTHCFQFFFQIKGDCCYG